MSKDARVDYDKEYDLLYVATGVKVKDSLEFDQFVIDFSSDDKIVGIEIMDASRYLKKLFDYDVDKEQLADIKKAKFSVIQQKDFAMIKIVMKIPLISGECVDRVLTAPAPVAVTA